MRMTNKTRYPDDIDAYLKLQESDLNHDLLIDGRSILHTLSLSLQKDLARAPVDAWRQMAAVSELQSSNALMIGDQVMASSYHNFALDCELHAFRLETSNNSQVMKHLRKLRNTLPGI
jgi:hypothetical protein